MFVNNKTFLILVFIASLELVTCQTTEDNLEWHIDPTTGCKFPAVLRKLTSDSTWKTLNFSGVQEVQFLGIVGPIEQKRICKIKCINGNWLGPLCSIEEDGGRFQPMLRNCQLENVPKDVILFYNGRQLDLGNHLGAMNFAHGTTLSLRCRQIGTFKFVGNTTLRCRNGQWDRRLPTCVPTTYLTNFSVYSPPTIIYQVPQGSAAPTDTGELLVYPNSIIHLDCFYRRQDGNPHWSWTSNHRQYPMGWAVPFHEKDWKYRLSIYYAKSQDGGTFTCTAPKGSSNSLMLRVKAVECPILVVNETGQALVSEGSKINHHARFSCAEGSVLIGAEEIQCLWTGRWSHEIPICHALQCPTLAVEEVNLKIVTQNVSHRGLAVFECPKGLRLVGSQELICLNGNWSEAMPYCEKVFCEIPLPPSNGRIIDNGTYVIDSEVRYVCDAGHKMIGESHILVCLENGNWSYTPPICKPTCPHPGDPANGRTSPSKENYDIGEWITVMCNTGYMIHGTQRLHCTEPKKWSHGLPDCKPFRVR